MEKPEFIARQGRRPSGLLGHLVARIMARETRPENDRMLELLELGESDQILEIGFGHGATLRRAAKIARQGRLSGIDFSDVMLTRARHLNRDLISEGRLELCKGDSQKIALEDGTFDKVFTMHTIYFWSDPDQHFAEAFRVLKPGGRFAIGYRSDADKGAVKAFPSSIYRFPTTAGVEMGLSAQGFEKPQTLTQDFRKRLMHWTLAEKPA